MFKFRKVQFGPLLSIRPISQKRCMLCPMFVWSTYTKSYMIIQLTLWTLTLDYRYRSNQGHRPFKGLCLINGASYNRNLYEIHIVSHIWPFSLPYNIWPLMKLKGQIKVIGFSAGYISYTKHVLAIVC